VIKISYMEREKSWTNTLIKGVYKNLVISMWCRTKWKFTHCIS